MNYRDQRPFCLFTFAVLTTVKHYINLNICTKPGLVMYITPMHWLQLRFTYIIALNGNPNV